MSRMNSWSDGYDKVWRRGPGGNISRSTILPRQRPEEILSDLLHDIRRLVVLAYPVPANETTEIVAKVAFLEAMRDKELSLKVREREPRMIDEAYRVALRLAAFKQTPELDEGRRLTHRVRGAKENDLVEQLQRQMERFFNEQRKWR